MGQKRSCCLPFALQVDLVGDGEEPPQIPAKDYRLAFKVLSSERVLGIGAGLHFLARAVRETSSYISVVLPSLCGLEGEAAGVLDAKR